MATRDSTIPSHMRAAVCHGIQDYRMATLAVPTPGPGEVLVRVSRCGLCAGDSKCFHGAPMFWDPTYSGSGLPYVDAPVTPGHEFVGNIAAFGEGAEEDTGLEIGDQVTSEQVVACKNCIYCRKGMRWLCAPHNIYGFKQATQGGCAEYMMFPKGCIVHKLPKGLPANEAVYVEPLSCGAHGADIASINLGDTVVCSGAGPIGLGFIASARKRGPGRLIALDCIDSRLELARQCGADVCLNPLKDDVVARIREMSDSSAGCDVYFEATGKGASVAQGLSACRKAATFVSFSVFEKPTTVDWTVIGDTKMLNIKGGHCSGDRGYQLAIDILSEGSMPVSDIVTHGLRLDNIVQGLEMVASPKDSIKVSMDPTLVS